jgi:DNA-binding MarR family transcriptional regulator
MKQDMPKDDIDLISEQWRQQGLDTDFNALQIIARVMLIAKNLETRVARLHKAFNLKQGEFDVLAALKRSPEDALTPSQLYQTMLLSSGAMTSRLDRLEKKQLIQRQHCTHDRRSIKVSLTDQGRKLVDQAYPAHFDMLEALLSPMSDIDKAQLAALLKKSLLHLETGQEVDE